MTLKAVIKICPQGNSWQFYNQFLLPFQACFLLKLLEKEVDSTHVMNLV